MTDEIFSDPWLRTATTQAITAATVKTTGRINLAFEPTGKIAIAPPVNARTIATPKTIPEMPTARFPGEVLNLPLGSVKRKRIMPI
ncbi:MAG TPA: hypothetical protein VKK61_01725 [Tepidisphaeraceae bacterium]|nr:hypothetical protein [Tepidisphaeraceae bacterium]